MKLKSLVLIATLIMSAPSVMAQENKGYNKTYDASYDYYMPSGVTSMRLSCDGNGRIRAETVMNGRSHVSITDYNAKASFGIDDVTKTVSKMALQNPPGAPPESEKVSLGEKVVNGHNCDGWQSTSNGHKTEAWIDKELGCTVLMTIDDKPKMKLRSATATNIGSQYFAPPAGYRRLDMDAGLRRAQEMAKKFQNKKPR